MPETDLPFDGDDPYESRERELEVAGEIIRQALAGFDLDLETPRDVPEEGDESLASPSLEELQAFYGRTPDRSWRGPRAERYRIYRSYSARNVAEPEDTDLRYVIIAYRRDSTGVTGYLHSYEA